MRRSFWWPRSSPTLRSSLGYVVLRENAVERSGVQLTNFLMEKDLGTGR